MIIWTMMNDRDVLAAPLSPQLFTQCIELNDCRPA